MSKVEETLQELIEFSQQQLLLEQRKLEAQGKSSNNVVMDAYRSIIANLSNVLGNKDSTKSTKSGSEKASASDEQEESDG